jgi:hypothetical protein
MAKGHIPSTRDILPLPDALRPPPHSSADTATYAQTGGRLESGLLDSGDPGLDSLSTEPAERLLARMPDEQSANHGVATPKPPLMRPAVPRSCGKVSLLTSIARPAALL